MQLTDKRTSNFTAEEDTTKLFEGWSHMFCFPPSHIPRSSFATKEKSRKMNPFSFNVELYHRKVNKSLREENDLLLDTVPLRDRQDSDEQKNPVAKFGKHLLNKVSVPKIAAVGAVGVITFVLLQKLVRKTSKKSEGRKVGLQDAFCDESNVKAISRMVTTSAVVDGKEVTVPDCHLLETEVELSEESYSPSTMTICSIQGTNVLPEKENNFEGATKTDIAIPVQFESNDWVTSTRQMPENETEKRKQKWRFDQIESRTPERHEQKYKEAVGEHFTQETLEQTSCFKHGTGQNEASDTSAHSQVFKEIVTEQSFVKSSPSGTDAEMVQGVNENILPQNSEGNEFTKCWIFNPDIPPPSTEEFLCDLKVFLNVNGSSGISEVEFQNLIESSVAHSKSQNGEVAEEGNQRRKEADGRINGKDACCLAAINSSVSQDKSNMERTEEIHSKASRKTNHQARDSFQKGPRGGRRRGRGKSTFRGSRKRGGNGQRNCKDTGTGYGWMDKRLRQSTEHKQSGSS